MNRLGAQVDGVRPTVRALGKIADEVVELSVANKRIGSSLVGRVQSRTRRSSGQLAAAWRPADTGGVYNPLDYAGPQEYGWPARGIEPTRAVHQAIDEQRDGILGEYEAELATIIRRHGG
jgi:hypothetical protein